jgi:hypothetical protein
MVTTVEAINGREKQLLRDVIKSFTIPIIAAFLESNNLQKSGTKEDLISRIETTASTGKLSYAQIVDWIDSIERWNKHHTYLFDGPENGVCQQWQDIQWVEKHLNANGMWHLFNKKLGLVLPETLEISAITHDGRTVTILAVEKRVYTEKVGEPVPDANNTELFLQQFKRCTDRGLIVFEWDTATNEAILQISQLSSGHDYEEIRDAFFGLVAPWLDLVDGGFRLVELSKIINKLHDMETTGDKSISSHEMRFDTQGNRQIAVKSRSASQSTLGEGPMDSALKYASDKGVGRFGNFYWLPIEGRPEIPKRVHVVINATRHRANFSAQNTEETVRYVLRTLRTLSQ